MDPIYIFNSRSGSSEHIGPKSKMYFLYNLWSKSNNFLTLKLISFWLASPTSSFFNPSPLNKRSFFFFYDPIYSRWFKSSTALDSSSVIILFHLEIWQEEALYIQ